jgi:hypothetical protein
MPAHAHYIVLIRRIHSSEPLAQGSRAPFIPALRKAAAENVFFDDPLCIGRESKD